MGRFFFGVLDIFYPRVLDTKNSKRQNFFTRTDTVTSSVFAFLQILSRSVY